MPGPLGIIAGGGALPLRLASAARQSGRAVFVIVIAGWADPAEYADLPHAVMRLGALGAILDRMRAEAVHQLLMAGRASRPTLAALRPDGPGLKLMARVGAAYFGGDDRLLRTITRILEEEGFEVLEVKAVLASLLPPPGPLGAHAPGTEAQADIARGIAVARALGAVDVGQGCVVQQGMVLAVEAIEGTDAMLERAGNLRRPGSGGVLVKLVKPGQDRRVDLPAMGPRTVAGAVAAGLAGIAIEAEGTVVVDREATVQAADAAGLFIVAIRPDEFTAEERTP